MASFTEDQYRRWDQMLTNRFRQQPNPNDSDDDSLPDLLEANQSSDSETEVEVCTQYGCNFLS